MMLLALMLQSSAEPPRMPAVPTPKAETAKCVGVDDANGLQGLTIESRWIEAERTTALIVIKDTSGLLKPGEWLENENPMWKDGDRKHGIALSWNGASFSKRVGNRYVRISMIVTGEASASILYLTRAYSDRERTAMRYSNGGSIMLAGRCTLFYGGAVRSYKNSSKLGRTY